MSNERRKSDRLAHAKQMTIEDNEIEASKKFKKPTKREKTPDIEESPQNQHTKNSKGAKNQKKKTKKDSNFIGEKKLVDYDERKELMEFLEMIKATKDKESQKTIKDEDDQENLFETYKKLQREVCYKALSLLDNMKLDSNSFISKMGVTANTTKKLEAQEQSSPVTKMEIEEEEEEEEEEKEKEKEIEPQEEEKHEIEIENEKEPQQKKRIFDLLMESVLNSDEEDINDEKLEALKFDPTYEMMIASDQIDIEALTNHADQSNFDQSTFIPSKDKVIIENLSEDYQKINDLVTGVNDVDLQRLDPQVYLNDSLINFYLKYLFEMIQLSNIFKRLIEVGLIHSERRDKIHIFNTYFMSKLRTAFLQVDNNFDCFDSIYKQFIRV